MLCCYLFYATVYLKLNSVHKKKHLCCCRWNVCAGLISDADVVFCISTLHIFPMVTQKKVTIYPHTKDTVSPFLSLTVKYNVTEHMGKITIWTNTKALWLQFSTLFNITTHYFRSSCKIQILAYSHKHCNAHKYEIKPIVS